MVRWLAILVRTLRSTIRTQRELALENLALRQQVAVWKVRQPRPQLTATDRLFWVVLSRLSKNWRSSVLVVLSHGRRRLRHFNITEHPTAEWTGRQLIEACGLEESPRHLIRDRDQVYGERFSRQARMLDVREAVIAPRSPWQNAYAERVIGSIRRECLDHVVVLGERHLRRILSTYVDYYNETRTHLSLAKDAPEPRSVPPPSHGRVMQVPRVGGLHHEYVRRAA